MKTNNKQVLLERIMKQKLQGRPKGPGGILIKAIPVEGSCQKGCEQCSDCVDDSCNHQICNGDYTCDCQIQISMCAPSKEIPV